MQVVDRGLTAGEHEVGVRVSDVRQDLPQTLECPESEGVLVLIGEAEDVRENVRPCQLWAKEPGHLVDVLDQADVEVFIGA